MRMLSGSEFPQFIAANPVAAIHFDAVWNSRLRALTRLKMLDAETALGNQAAFAEIDSDREPDLAKSIPHVRRMFLKSRISDR